ncbi:hypothetical protein KSS87_020697 [Heliosperma pusillum]|nr:hypothetical protein KSS87_020697 [Heliosperma pusillum]
METEFSTLLNCAQGTTGLFFSYDVNLSLRYLNGYFPRLWFLVLIISFFM